MFLQSVGQKRLTKPWFVIYLISQPRVVPMFEGVNPGR